jgi:hypothetical protein
VNWLKQVDLAAILERISSRKLAVIGGFTMLGCIVYLSYLVLTKPTACEIHHNKVENGGIISCGEVKVPNQERVAPAPAPDPQVAWREDIVQAAKAILGKALEERQLRIAELKQSEEAKPPRILIIQIFPEAKPKPPVAKQPKNAAKGKRNAGPRIKHEPDDPEPGRTIKVIPDIDTTNAILESLPVEHSCLIDRFEACNFSAEDRRRMLVKIPLDDYLYLIQGNGLRSLSP